MARDSVKQYRFDAVMQERIEEAIAEAEGDLSRLSLREDARADRWAGEWIRLGLDLSGSIPDPVKAEEAAKRVVGFACRLFDLPFDLPFNLPCGKASYEEAMELWEELGGKIVGAVGAIVSVAGMYKYMQEQGKGKEMVTIARIVQETGINERTFRARVQTAQERGRIKEGLDWERQGGTILIDRKVGIQLATEVKKPGPQRDR